MYRMRLLPGAFKILRFQIRMNTCHNHNIHRGNLQERGHDATSFGVLYCIRCKSSLDDYLRSVCHFTSLRYINIRDMYSDVSISLHIPVTFINLHNKSAVMFTDPYPRLFPPPAFTPDTYNADIYIARFHPYAIYLDDVPKCRFTRVSVLHELVGILRTLNS